MSVSRFTERDLAQAERAVVSQKDRAVRAEAEVARLRALIAQKDAALRLARMWAGQRITVEARAVIDEALEAK